MVRSDNDNISPFDQVIYLEMKNNSSELDSESVKPSERWLVPGSKRERLPAKRKAKIVLGTAKSWKTSAKCTYVYLLN